MHRQTANMQLGDIMFDWDDLRVFLAVARAKRIAPAAMTLGVDATTVTRRLARLSDALETALFELVGNERQLTERGQSLFDHAESIESAALAALQDVGGDAHSLSGLIRLSAPEGFASWILASALPDFQQLHPNIEIDVMTASGFLNPSRRQADMAVMLARPRSGRLVAAKLTDYRLGLYASKHYLATHTVPMTVGDLKLHCLIGYVPELVESPELDYLDEVDKEQSARLRSTSITVQHRMIHEGCGIGLLPAFIGESDSSLIPLFLTEIIVKRSFWLVTHSDRRNVARIRLFKKFLHETIAALNANAVFLPPPRTT